MVAAAIFNQIASRIIREQELVIGPLAWSEAGKVSGLRVLDPKKGEVSVENGDPKTVIDHLVGRYERLFGKASHEVCREAVVGMIVELSPTDIPISLRTA